MSDISACPHHGVPISKTIKTTIDGIDVEGFLTGTSCSITVTISKPFQNLNQCWAIMTQLRGHRSFDGDYGLARGRETLANLYRIGMYLQLHEDALRGRIEPFEQRLAVLQGGDDEEIELQNGSIREEFFDAHLPDVVSVSLQAAVWEILTGRKSLVQIPEGVNDENTDCAISY
jgi:hypothetical protein